MSAGKLQMTAGKIAFLSLDLLKILRAVVAEGTLEVRRQGLAHILIAADLAAPDRGFGLGFRRGGLDAALVIGVGGGGRSFCRMASSTSATKRVWLPKSSDDTTRQAKTAGAKGR